MRTDRRSHRANRGARAGPARGKAPHSPRQIITPKTGAAHSRNGQRAGPSQGAPRLPLTGLLETLETRSRYQTPISSPRTQPQTPAPDAPDRETRVSNSRTPSSNLAPLLGPESTSPPHTCLQSPRRSPVSVRGAVASTASTGRRCSQRKPRADRAGGACRRPHAPRRSLEPASGTTGTAELIRGRTEAGPAPSPAPRSRPRPRPGHRGLSSRAEIPAETCLSSPYPPTSALLPSTF